MQYVVDNYDTIAEAALIVPMDDDAGRGGERQPRQGARVVAEARLASQAMEAGTQTLAARRRGHVPSAPRAVAGARRSSAPSSSSPR